MASKHTPTAPSTGSGTRGFGRNKTAMLGLLAAVALVASACTGPASAPLDIEIPLEPITVDLPSIDVDLGLCVATVALPSIVIDGLVFAIPELAVDPDGGTITLPNVGLNAPESSSTFSGIEASCFGMEPAVLALDITIPAISAGGSVTVDFEAKQLVVDELLVDISGGQVAFPDLGGLVVPIPAILIPLDGIVVPF